MQTAAEEENSKAKPKRVCSKIIVPVIIVLVLNVALAANYFSYAAQAQQQQQQQPPQQLQTGVDGNLTASINGDSFAAGDRIRINGTVAKEGRDYGAVVVIGVIDPKNFSVESATVSPDPTTGGFAHEFVAGIVRQFDPDRIMRESGNYTVRILYTPPYIYGQEIPTERVNFTFAYKALE